MDKKVIEYISENQLASFMNNTKWKKIINEITSNENFDPCVRIKLIFDNENKDGFSPVWWDEVERNGYEVIEWIQIKPIKENYIGKLVNPDQTDYSEFIKKGLDKHNIPYEVDDGIFKVYGYKRTELKSKN